MTRPSSSFPGQAAHLSEPSGQASYPGHHRSIEPADSQSRPQHQRRLAGRQPRSFQVHPTISRLTRATTRSARRCEHVPPPSARQGRRRYAKLSKSELAISRLMAIDPASAAEMRTTCPGSKDSNAQSSTTRRTKSPQRREGHQRQATCFSSSTPPNPSRRASQPTVSLKSVRTRSVASQAAGSCGNDVRITAVGVGPTGSPPSS